MYSSWVFLFELVHQRKPVYNIFSSGNTSSEMNSLNSYLLVVSRQNQLAAELSFNHSC